MSATTRRFELRAGALPVWPVALAFSVVGVAIAYAVAGRMLHGPSVPNDELVYMEAARSLAHQGRPLVRGEPYGFGLLYPAMLAPIVRLASNQLRAYELVKAANSLLFCLAGIPVYFLARRLLAVPWSVCVAVLAVAVPSGMYTGLVLTENAAYLVAELAFLAVVLMLERPTAVRQLGVAGTLLLAVAARPQFLALVPVIVVAAGVRSFVLPEGRPLAQLRRLWPLAASGALAGAALLASALARGTSVLGDYGTVARSYDPIEIARSAWYSLAGLDLYVAFVPVVVAPAALLWAFRRGRRGQTQHAAFASLFVAANLVLVVEVGALMTTPLLGGLLHDRYLFYLVPLWLVLLCAWIQSGDIPSRVALGAGGAVAVALALTLPTRLVIGESARIDALGIALWVKLRELAPTHPGLVRVWMVAGALGALAAVWLLVPRLRVLLVVPIAAAFVANAVFVWKPRVADADRPVFSGRLSAEATWVDDVVPSGSSVSTLWVSSAQCPAGMRDAFIWTEFFNGRVGRAAHDGTPYLPITSAAVHVGSGGVLRTANGRHLQAAFVVAQPGIRIRGRLLASGTRWHLGLWRVRGDVVVRGVGSTAALEAGACRAPGASQG